MLSTIKRKAADGLLVVVEVAGLLLSASGASVVAFFGKLMLAGILAAVALGFFLRLVGRRQQKSVLPASTPRWCYFLWALLAVVEVSLLVEIAQLPVRFYQPGFEIWHWALVAIALWACFMVNMQMFRLITVRR